MCDGVRENSTSSRLAPSSSATTVPSRITRIRVLSPSSSSVSDDTITTAMPVFASSAISR